MGFLNHSILLTGLGLKAQFYGKTVLQTIKGIFVVKSLSEFSQREYQPGTKSGKHRKLLTLFYCG